MQSRIGRTNIEGFEAIRLSNETTELTVVPELGAKIISLLNRSSGREWMWRSRKSPQLFKTARGEDFSQGPLLGADECIPTISPCCWSNRDLPDHGEACTASWQLDEEALSRSKVTTRVELVTLPLLLERTISLRNNTFTFEYELTNRSDDSVYYLWAFHPMMTVEQDDRILMPEDAKLMQIELLMGSFDLDPGCEAISWPRPNTEIDFYRLELGPGDRAIKLFTPSMSIGAQVTLYNPHTGDGLTFKCIDDEVCTFGIWINRRAFGGYEHVAIEPTNCGTDSHTVAARCPSPQTEIKAFQSKLWRFQIIINNCCPDVSL